MHKSIRGVFAAVLTPRLSSGMLDARAMRQNVEWLVASGVDGVVINGATGEYNRTDLAEFEQILSLTKQSSSAKPFIAGIGASDWRTSVRLGEQAFEAGAVAVLLPAPHFFTYSQDDITDFCTSVAGSLQGDVLLYNLPQFTNGFALNTVEKLLSTSPAVKGIKDSSGSLEILRALTAAGAPGVVRIVGSDAVLAQARREGLCDAVISGVAGVLPELILLLGGDRSKAGPERYEEAVRLLDQLLQQLHECPVPSGLKWIAECRGAAQHEMPYPLSAARLEQRRSFQSWFDRWLARAWPVLQGAPAVAADSRDLG